MEQTSRESRDRQNRQCVLGLEAADVAGGESRVFIFNAHETPVTPKRLMIPSEIGVNFEVENVKIGEKNLFQRGNSIPATIFSESAFGQDLSSDDSLADVGTPISITVKNIVAAKKPFVASIVCRTVETESVAFDEFPIGNVGQSSDYLRNPGIGLDGPSEGCFGHDHDGKFSDGYFQKRFGAPLLSEAEYGNDISDMMDGTNLRSIKALEHIATLIADLTKPKIAEKKELPTYMLGFGVTVIPGESSADIRNRPQVLFRPEHISIPDSMADKFMIVDIKVGQNSQFAAVGEVSAGSFRETAPLKKLKLDVCQISMDIIITVRNKAKQQEEFSATMFGPAIH